MSPEESLKNIREEAAGGYRDAQKRCKEQVDQGV